MKIQGLTFAISAIAISSAFADSLPRAITQQLPSGYEVIKSQAGDFNQDELPDYIVIAGDKREKQLAESGEPAPKRWLLAFIQASAGTFKLVGKNQEVAFAADQAMQCDPLLDSGGITTKGLYFTVENSTACGEHWTDYITFKYDKEHGKFLFHKRITEAWKLNSSEEPGADALVRSQRHVTSARANKPIVLNDYSLR